MRIAQALLEKIRTPDRRSTRFLKASVRRLLRAEMPATPLHSLLVAERLVRRLALGHLARALYYQPMLRTMCTRSGQGLGLDIGTGLPVFYGVDVELGDHVTMTGLLTVSGAVRSDGRRPRCVIGDHAYLGYRVNITVGSEVLIGRHVLVSSDVFLCGYDAHPVDPLARRTQPAPLGDDEDCRIVIEDDVWICHGAHLAKGVRVGAGAIVAAAAVVTRDVPPGSIVAGNPARVVGNANAARSAAALK
jgi:acetyltransferase-like isoleucine patch superfamily enzyme